MRSDDRLFLIRVIEAPDVLEVRDIKGCDVVAERDGEVGETAVVRDVGVDGDGFLGFLA